MTYVTNSTLSWVGYSIDGANNVTVTGNGTAVIELVASTEYHTLTVYAMPEEFLKQFRLKSKGSSTRTV